MDPILIGALAALAVVTFLLSPRVHAADAFFKGWSDDGAQPGLLTLTLSQVTTWIFARSLLTAAILGYYYGIAGGLAYAAYYLSFLTGGAIIASLRFRHGYESVQAFLTARFGARGVWCYNFVVSLRLLSEVFANLLVIGMIFGESGSLAYAVAIVVLAAITLGYSMLGGLRASLRTDVFQMSAFLVLLAIILYHLLSTETWSAGAIVSSSPLALENGWNLLLVALLQVWSYPLHDPVMMDRGFISDRRTTLRSFWHAGWISVLCILAFSLLGVHAGLQKMPGEEMMAVLTRLLGSEAMLFINLALIVSAVSTLDSTLSSSAKLAIVDMGVAERTVANGRKAMALFMAGGLAFLFGGSNDLYSAVAVSGTASMYLAPVIFFSIWGNVRDIPLWSYLTAFVAAVGGAALYFAEAGGHWSLMEPAFGIMVKYNKLLAICIAVLVIGNAAFAIGMWQQRNRAGAAPAA